MSQNYSQNPEFSNYTNYGYPQGYRAVPPGYGGGQQQYATQQQAPAQPGAPSAITPSLPGQLPIEASYIENILRLNKGKLATVYTTFENNTQWNAKIFKGIIEAAGRDHLILSDPQSGVRYLIPMVYLDYITFDEEIEYEYPYGAGAPNLSTYPPR
ncbi:spore coat protein GerQ [Niallia sp. 03133]|uniref:spore coat protein GerQ n=1 Tax=Niallia sp. 03133 TaxID=3458060 RepID=UPI004044DDF9